MAAICRFILISAMVFLYSAVVSADWDDDWGWDSPVSWGSGWGGWGNNFFQQPQQPVQQQWRQNPQPVQQQWRQNPQPVQQQWRQNPQPVQQQWRQNPQPVQQQWRPNPFMSAWLMDEFMDW